MSLNLKLTENGTGIRRLIVYIQSGEFRNTWVEKPAGCRFDGIWRRFHSLTFSSPVEWCVRKYFLADFLSCGWTYIQSVKPIACRYSAVLLDEQQGFLNEVVLDLYEAWNCWMSFSSSSDRRCMQQNNQIRLYSTRRTFWDSSQSSCHAPGSVSWCSFTKCCNQYGQIAAVINKAHPGGHIYHQTIGWKQRKALLITVWRMKIGTIQPETTMY